MDNWKVWLNNDNVEARTYKRVTGELPEMESTKQLVDIISEIYVEGMTILDVGCAAGHYYKGLQRIDKDISYFGFDLSKKHIEFAKEYFKNTSAEFYNIDILDWPQKSDELNPKFDIVYCCNVILHLPDFKIALKNLLNLTKKYCIIKTLLDDKTHLSKYLYTDDFDENSEPTNFVYQNTYSFNLFTKYIESLGDYKIEYIDDKFCAENINNEHKDFNKIQDSVTIVTNGMQIAGNKVFKWKWIKITKV